ncbi:hypothetical protein HMSSN036_74660 [Paenibacillus macerans]|nr:hypothetical protein HMSSN036_74660 [Paenibacillus macerans]
MINSDDEQWILNKGGVEVKKVHLGDNVQDNQFEMTDENELVIVKNTDNSNEEDLLFFHVQLPHTVIPFAVQDVVERPIPIGGFSIWKLKREKQEHFVYRIENEKMKIIQGTRETYAQGEFKRNLERELKMIESNHLYFIEESGDMSPEVITVSEPIREAYTDLLRFFRVNNLLPSLAFFDEEYIALVKRYVNVYLDELNKLKNGQSLDQSQRDLALIGTIRKGLKDPEWLFTPLHPLNLAYQLQLNDLIGSEVINDELLRSLRPTNLLPYVSFNSTLYKATEQNDSYEWTTYINQNLPRFESSKFYVGKLVQEKIEEFTGHFSYLFELDYRAPLKINTINMGDCREILQGLFEYYKQQLKGNAEKQNCCRSNFIFMLRKELTTYLRKCLNIQIQRKLQAFSI